MKLLVVEDNARLGPLLASGLRDEGHVVDLVANGTDALAYATASHYDAIVLDLMLPGIDGLTLLDRLRQGGTSTPVLILTARDDVESRVEGLDRGGDDYLVKPFDFDELLARLRALVRRSTSAGTASILRVADLSIDLGHKEVVRGGEPVRLSAREWAMLECLALRKGRVVSRTTLLDVVYDGADPPESNVVEVYIGYLRRKIDRGRDVKLIHTRRGMGYLLSEVP